jgi:hypothetical protein
MIDQGSQRDAINRNSYELLKIIPRLCNSTVVINLVLLMLLRAHFRNFQLKKIVKKFVEYPTNALTVNWWSREKKTFKKSAEKGNVSFGQLTSHLTSL